MHTNIRFKINTKKNENVNVLCEQETFEQGTLCKIHLECQGLKKDHPIQAFITFEELPEKITAMYMYNPWWTRPAFLSSFEEIPEKTQVLFLKFKDQFACLLPMIGDRFKTMAVPGTKEELCLEMTAFLEGMTVADEPLYMMTCDKSLYEAVRKLFVKLCEYKGIRRREERTLPEMFHYLGWCSWDAFYTDITEEKVRAKAKELKEKQVPIKWLLMDDGWLNVTERLLNDFEPDKEKFPNAFAQMIRDIREENDVKWFGVWHTLAGYWDGVTPGSVLAEKQADNLFETVNGLLLPDPKQKGSNFFVDWYTYLKSQGIDFTKVDGQSNVREHYEDTLPVSEAAKGSNTALEKASMWMQGAVINCMGMAMENIVARPNTALSRNSDDFFPEKEEGFVEHLLQNAYNSIYHDEIYHCDWDMFWTMHPDSKKHRFLRAVSGSPLYFSDRIGETDPDIIKPLIYLDGEVLMMDRSAKPTEDCIFMNPQKDAILKLQNTAKNPAGQMMGGIAAFNLTGQKQTTTFSPMDIKDLPDAKEYWIYDYFRKQVVIVNKEEKYSFELMPEAYGWYMVFPKETSKLCVGLSEKYVGSLAVEAVKDSGDFQQLVLKEKGNVAWIAETALKQVVVDGLDLTAKVQKKAEYLYELELPEEDGKCVIYIQ